MRKITAVITALIALVLASCASTRSAITPLSSDAQASSATHNVPLAREHRFKGGGCIQFMSIGKPMMTEVYSYLPESFWLKNIRECEKALSGKSFTRFEAVGYRLNHPPMEARILDEMVCSIELAVSTPKTYHLSFFELGDVSYEEVVTCFKASAVLLKSFEDSTQPQKSMLPHS